MARDPVVLDPRRKVSFAYDKLRSRYKEIQRELKKHDRYKAMLKEELQPLTKILETNWLDEVIQDWEGLRSNLLEIECEDAARWHCYSRNKWLGEGNEPFPYFFKVTIDK